MRRVIVAAPVKDATVVAVLSSEQGGAAVEKIMRHQLLTDGTQVHMLRYVIDAKERGRDIAERPPTVIRGARA